MSTPVPSGEELEELLLSCRYGDLEEIQQFVTKFGPEHLSDVRDENGNTILHMVCGNGHTGEQNPSINVSHLSDQISFMKDVS